MGYAERLFAVLIEHIDRTPAAVLREQIAQIDKRYWRAMATRQEPVRLPDVSITTYTPCQPLAAACDYDYVYNCAA